MRLKMKAESCRLPAISDPQTLVENAGNTIVFEHDANLKDQVFKLFSTNHSPESQANCLSELMCCLPEIAAPAGVWLSKRIPRV